MKPFVITLAVVFFVTSLFSQQNEAVLKLVKEGIELHDKEMYDAALKKYDEALAIDKDNYDANYEKSLTLLYAKRFDECAAVSKILIEKHKDNLKTKAVYCNYGSALDEGGKAGAAMTVFDKGIKQFPDFYLLYYNKALTLGRLKKWDDALPAFMNALKNKPDHAGSLYYVSMLLENDNKVAAIISCLTFLALEPEGKRAKSTYTYLNELLESFVKKEKDGNSVIMIEANSLDKKKEENNFSMVQMTLGLTAAAAIEDTVKAKTKVDKLSQQIQMMITSLAVGKKDGRGIFWGIYAPFFISMKEQDLVPVFAHIASITSGDDDNIKWINDNQEKLDKLNKWLQAYKWETKK